MLLLKVLAVLAVLAWPTGGGGGTGSFGGTQSEITRGTETVDWSLTPVGIEDSILISRPIGHKTQTPLPWRPRRVCLSMEAALHLVELTAVNMEAVNEFWMQMAVGNQCKYFPPGLAFWPDEVIVEVEWGDGTPMYIVRGHDIQEVELFAWAPVSKAREWNIPPPGLSSAGVAPFEKQWWELDI